MDLEREKKELVARTREEQGRVNLEFDRLVTRIERAESTNDLLLALHRHLSESSARMRELKGSMRGGTVCGGACWCRRMNDAV